MFYLRVYLAIAAINMVCRATKKEAVMAVSSLNIVLWESGTGVVGQRPAVLDQSLHVT